MRLSSSFLVPQQCFLPNWRHPPVGFALYHAVTAQSLHYKPQVLAPGPGADPLSHDGLLQMYLANAHEHVYMNKQDYVQYETVKLYKTFKTFTSVVKVALLTTYRRATYL